MFRNIFKRFWGFKAYSGAVVATCASAMIYSQNETLHPKVHHKEKPHPNPSSTSPTAPHQKPYTMDQPKNMLPFPDESEYELIKVQYISRHGARTPITEFPNQNTMMEVQGYEFRCPPMYLFSTPHIFSSSYAADEQPLFAKTENIGHKQKLRGNCQKGQLTTLGMQQMLQKGQFAFQKYANKLFSVKDLENNFEDLIYFRSTDIPTRRTEMSALYFAMGFVPFELRKQIVPTIFLMESRVETMYPHSTRCKRLGELIKQRKNSEEVKQISANIAGIGDVQQKLDDIFGKGTVQADEIHNTLRAILYDQKPLPVGLTEEDANKVEEAAAIMAGKVFEGEELNRLSIGPFISELLHTQQNTVDFYQGKTNKSGHIMEAYFGHDTSLIPLLTALDTYKQFNEWPGFAANCTFELYRRHKSKNEFYIRLLFDDRILKIPGCEKIAPATKDGLYPFDAFKEVATKLIPKDYKQECSLADVKATLQQANIA